jgi:hypothetical protein
MPTACLGGSHACAGAFADKAALELGHCSHHMEERPTAGRRLVDRFGEREKAYARYDRFEVIAPSSRLGRLRFHGSSGE